MGNIETYHALSVVDVFCLRPGPNGGKPLPGKITFLSRHINRHIR